MNAKDLIDYVLQGENGDYKTTIQILNEFVVTLLDENIKCEFGMSLAEELEEFAIHNGRCPECGDRLVYKKVKGNESEAWGLPVVEETTEATCSSCGFCWD